MADGILTKVQRNALWRALAEGGCIPGDFDLDVKDKVVAVRHPPSNSWFYIERNRDRFHFSSRVGDEPSVPLTVSSFESIANRVTTWGREACEWADTPDLWTSKPNPSAIPGDLTPDSSNSPFSLDEQAAISAQLKAIAQKVKETYDLTAEQSAKVDEKFKEAEKASKRMGRKDWGLLFGGAVFSLILADVITPGVAGHVLMMIEHGLGHLFTGGTPAIGGVLSAGRD